MPDLKKLLKSLEAEVAAFTGTGFKSDPLSPPEAKSQTGPASDEPPSAPLSPIHNRLLDAYREW
jgi:hypothetical protein